MARNSIDLPDIQLSEHDEPISFKRQRSGRQSNWKGGRDRRFPEGKLQNARFVAWDGEGYSDPETNEHHYMLFGNSDGTYIAGEGLHFDDCFEFLLEHADQDANHIIYGGDYDVIMMTKAFPYPVRKRLHSGQRTSYGGYIFEWRKRKWFDIRYRNGSKSVRLYDVLTFFQKSFVNACREYLGDSEDLDVMESMKSVRNEFRFEMLETEVIPYWKSELQYLVQLADQLRDYLHAVDIKPIGWYGPGPVASSVLSNHKAGEHFGYHPSEVIDKAERAYYGGRFEQFFMGVADKTYEYDIRSAYPAAISLMPSFADVEWKHNYLASVPSELNDWTLYKVSWSMAPFNSPVWIGPLPFRDDRGRIYYPQQGTRSWYWGIEVKNLTKLSHIKYVFHESWTPTFHRGYEFPFRWISDMYYDRQKMKSDGNPAQLALKLGMNSVYGKLAQSKGAKYEYEPETGEGHWKKPRWHHPFYAGWITAYCRAKMWDLVCTALQQEVPIYSLETDAIFVGDKLSGLDLGTGLGQFDEIELDGFISIQSGVHYDKVDGAWQLRSRGVEAKATQRAEEWFDIFRELPENHVDVTWEVTRFITNPASRTYARWEPFKRTTSFPNIVSKRMHNAKLCKQCRDDPSSTMADDMHMLAVPPTVSDVVPSVAYGFPWRKDGVSFDPDDLKIGIAESYDERMT